jgi:hypothetical protein
LGGEMKSMTIDMIYMEIVEKLMRY